MNSLLKKGNFLFMIAEMKPIWYTLYKVRILYVKKGNEK